jgi:nucleotide-binding universal stress UspA family protein
MLNLMMGDKMKILVAYLGGHNILDTAVLKVAKQHAKAFNATLYIINSVEKVGSGNQLIKLEKNKKHLAHIKETMEAEGITCKTSISVHDVTPGENIVEYAVDMKIDEIIIGIEKKSRVGKLLFGSNAQYIILESPCPVVSVK